VHSKSSMFFNIGSTLIGPSQKKVMILLILSKLKTFSTNMGLWWCFLLISLIYIWYKTKLLGKGKGKNCGGDFKEYFCMHKFTCILPHLIFWVEFIFLILFIIIRLRLLQELGHLLWFILISLINWCISKHKCLYSSFLQWVTLIGPSSKKFSIPQPICTLFYINVFILHLGPL
jgi:hypothetical protein